MSETSEISKRKVSPLMQFAFLGGQKFTTKLEYLSAIAEKENWYYDAPKIEDPRQKKIGVLYQYIHHTFARAQEEGKILETDSCAIMNTGLFTPNGEEIFCLFEPNYRYGCTPDAEKWYLKSFYKESSNNLPEQVRGHLPEYVNYFADCPHDTYFDTSKRILINIDHILDDHFERLPDNIRTMPKDFIKMLFMSAEKIMKRKISRNNRLVVPQYYKRQIMYLAPLQISSDIIPLAIEKQENIYRVNTIFTQGMAYCNARLLMKPESNWLTNDSPPASYKKKEGVSDSKLFH